MINQAAQQNRTAHKTSSRIEQRNGVYQYRYLSTRISLKTNNKLQAMQLEQEFRNMEELMQPQDLKQAFIEALVRHRKYLAAMNLEQSKLDYIGRIEASGLFPDDSKPIGYKRELDWLVKELRTELQPEPIINPVQTPVVGSKPVTPTRDTSTYLELDDLLEWFTEFLAELRNTNASLATIRAYTSRFRNFVRFCAESKINQIDRTIAIAYADWLKKSYSVSGVNQNITLMGTFFNELSRLDKTTLRIWDGLKVKKRGIQKKDDDKATSEKDAEFIFDKAMQEDRIGYKWIPLIAMYTGCRLGEAAQLHSDDLVEVDGVKCVSFNNEKDKTIKNAGSIRMVPLHSELLELGVWELKVNGGWLYEEEKFNAGKVGYNWNRKYRKHIDSTFHGLRHRAITNMLKNGADHAVVSAIAGHSSGSITIDVYSSGFSIKKLSQAVELIEAS